MGQGRMKDQPKVQLRLRQLSKLQDPNTFISQVPEPYLFFFSGQVLDFLWLSIIVFIL
jgi:hypothetical protein